MEGRGEVQGDDNIESIVQTTDNWYNYIIIGAATWCQISIVRYLFLLNRDYSLHRQIVIGLIMLLLVTGGDAALAVTCTPTPWDEIGPFYRPNAPVRNTIGKGYFLSGTVRSADDSRPLPNIRIEVWQVGPGGEYNADHRATLFSDQNGRYRV